MVLLEKVGLRKGKWGKHPTLVTWRLLWILGNVYSSVLTTTTMEEKQHIIRKRSWAYN